MRKRKVVDWMDGDDAVVGVAKGIGKKTLDTCPSSTLILLIIHQTIIHSEMNSRMKRLTGWLAGWHTGWMDCVHICVYYMCSALFCSVQLSSIRDDYAYNTKLEHTKAHTQAHTKQCHISKHRENVRVSDRVFCCWHNHIAHSIPSMYLLTYTHNNDNNDNRIIENKLRCVCVMCVLSAHIIFE